MLHEKQSRKCGEKAAADSGAGAGSRFKCRFRSSVFGKCGGEERQKTEAYFASPLPHPFHVCSNLSMFSQKFLLGVKDTHRLAKVGEQDKLPLSERRLNLGERRPSRWEKVILS